MQIAGTTFDAFDFQWDGDPDSSARFERKTEETLGTSSVTVATEHKTRFRFSLRNISTTDRDALVTAWNAASFTFTASPYCATAWTCKVIDPGRWVYRQNATNRFDNTGIVIEVV
jgi:hypothetical protein